MLQERITIHPDEVIQQILHKVDGLKPFQYDTRYRALLGDEFLKKITSWEQTIQRRREDPMTLVVCGEFKRGKSSLINAILGEEICPTNVTTETVTLNKISYGDHRNEAILSGGRRLKLTDEEMTRSSLEEIMEKLGEPIRQIEIYRPLSILKDVTIIDTPGLGDALQDFSDLVDYALSQADAVLYLFSAAYPLSQTEQLFIKSEILPQKYTDLFLVTNCCDMIPSTADHTRMRTMLTQRISDLLPGQEPIMLSALDERCRQLGEERPNRELMHLLEDSFDSFRAQISTLIEQKRYMVIPDRLQRLVAAMTADLNGMLTAMEAGLAMDSSDAQAAAETLRQRCDAQTAAQADNHRVIEKMIADMRAEASLWLGALLEKMEAEVSRLTNLSGADLRKYYTFYCIDKMQEGMNACLDYHTDRLYDQLDDISASLVRELSQNAEEQSFHFRFAMNNLTWTKGDNVGFIASKINLGAISLILQGISGALRSKEIKEDVPKMLAEITKQYPKFRNSVNDALDIAYGKLSERIMSQLDAYHAEQIRTAQEQSEQSALVARQDAAQKAEIKAVVAELRKVLADMNQPIQ